MPILARKRNFTDWFKKSVRIRVNLWPIFCFLAFLAPDLELLRLKMPEKKLTPPAPPRLSGGGEAISAEGNAFSYPN